MNPRLSVLIRSGDSLSEALDLLTQRASLGLVDPFIDTDPRLLTDRPASGKSRLSDRAGRREVDLLVTLGQQEYETIRVAAIAGPDLQDARQLGELTREVCANLRSLAPPGLRVVEVRMWIPLRADLIGSGESLPQEIFFPKADANLVVIPEDRSRSDAIASPILQLDSAIFAEHVATETATLLGLWAGMTEAPVDNLESGVMGFGEPMVHLARSFVRVAQIETPPFATSFNHKGHLPVPRGMVDVPYPEAGARELADQFDSRVAESFEFHCSDPPARGGWQAIFIRLGRGITSFLSRLPEWLLASSRDPVVKIVRREMPDSSVAADVAAAIGRDFESEPEKGEEIAEAAADGIRLSGGAEIPQQLWKDMGEAVMGSVDGGEMPEGILPPRSHGQHALITDLGVLFPCPKRRRIHDGYDSPSLPDRIRQDTRTLFGQISAALSGIADTNRERLRAAVAEFDDEFTDLPRRQLPDLAWIAVVFAGLLLAAVVGLILGTGTAEALGIVTMTGYQRTFVWAIVSGLMVAAIVATAVSAQNELQSAAERHARGRGKIRQALTRMAAVATAMAAASGITYSVTQNVRPYDALGFGAALGLITLQGGLIWIFRSTPVSGRVNRQFILITMVYVAIGLIGLLARDHGWYGNIGPADRMFRLGVATAVVLGLTAVLLMVAGWWYGREEYLLRLQLRRLTYLEGDIVGAVRKEMETEEAREQFVGSSAAWADLLWHPFGADDHPESDNLRPQAFSARKAVLESYRMPIGWQETAREKWVQRMAVPGWISHQYETAVRNFQQHYAGGLAARDAEMPRPDQDPRVVSHLPDPERARISLRWRFLSTLRSGEHDPVLRQRFETTQNPEGAQWFLNEIDTLRPSDPRSRPCRDFLVSILPERDAQVDTGYFQQIALSNKADRSWKPRVWLPPIDHDPPEVEAELGQAAICLLHNGHHAVISARHDLAGPYELTALFTETTPSAHAPPESASPGSEPSL